MTFIIAITVCGDESPAPDEDQSSAPSGNLYEASASAESLQDADWQAVELDMETEAPEVYKEA